MGKTYNWTVEHIPASFDMSPEKLLDKYPAISDLKKRAKRRTPHVAWEYLIGGTTDERLVQRNIDGLANILLVPRFLKGELKPDISTTLFGQSYSAPFGVAPIGLAGIIWPRAEVYLAQMANRHQIPYTLSTMAAETPETVGQHVGSMGWFQLYPPREEAVLRDLLARVKASGFKVLVLTVDIPAPSRRERMKRAGFERPPRISPRLLVQGMTRPTWALATLKRGIPNLRTLAKYVDSPTIKNVAAFTNTSIGGTLSWDYLKLVRDIWQEPLVVKGILHPADAEQAVSLGVDGIQVSNHGGRQFDGCPAGIDSLPPIVQAVGHKTTILFDSGVRTGLDIIRALALGADFVFLGRAFMYGIAALGQRGGDHATRILKIDLKTNMAQLGVTSIQQVKALEPA